MTVWTKSWNGRFRFPYGGRKHPAGRTSRSTAQRRRRTSEGRARRAAVSRAVHYPVTGGPDAPAYRSSVARFTLIGSPWHRKRRGPCRKSLRSSGDWRRWATTSRTCLSARSTGLPTASGVSEKASRVRISPSGPLSSSRLATPSANVSTRIWPGPRGDGRAWGILEATRRPGSKGVTR